MATMMITICGVHASLRRLWDHELALFHILLYLLSACQYEELRRGSTDQRVIIPGLVIKNGSCAADVYESPVTHRYDPALEVQRATQA